jgi:hypothetical protein
VAHADAPDDQFINSLGTQGITGDRGQLIGDGHAMCDAYGSAANHRAHAANRRPGLRQNPGIERDARWAAGVLPRKDSASVITFEVGNRIALVRV